MKYIGIIYFILAAFIIVFGVLNLVNGSGRLWINILIVVIGAYYLYRGVATTVNRINRSKEE